MSRRRRGEGTADRFRGGPAGPRAGGAGRGGAERGVDQGAAGLDGQDGAGRGEGEVGEHRYLELPGGGDPFVRVLGALDRPRDVAGGRGERGTLGDADLVLFGPADGEHAQQGAASPERQAQTASGPYPATSARRSGTNIARRSRRARALGNAASADRVRTSCSTEFASSRSGIRCGSPWPATSRPRHGGIPTRARRWLSRRRRSSSSEGRANSSEAFNNSSAWSRPVWTSCSRRSAAARAASRSARSGRDRRPGLGQADHAGQDLPAVPGRRT